MPTIVLGGAGLLGWIGGGLIVDDPFVDRFDWLQSDWVVYVASAIGAAFVMCVGLGLKNARRRKAAGA